MSDRHSGGAAAGLRHRCCSDAYCLALHPVGCRHHHHQHFACDLPWFHAVCPVDGALVLFQAWKMAAKVSPVEAIKYTDAMQTKKKQRSTRGAKLHQMAFANLGRNKKKTVLVVLSLALSVTLFNALCAFVGGFSMEKYVSSMTCADFIVSTPDYFHSTRQMNSSRQNRSRRSQQTQRPVFPARDMLCEKPHTCG